MSNANEICVHLKTRRIPGAAFTRLSSILKASRISLKRAHLFHRSAMYYTLSQLLHLTKTPNRQREENLKRSSAIQPVKAASRTETRFGDSQDRWTIVTLILRRNETNGQPKEKKKTKKKERRGERKRGKKQTTQTTIEDGNVVRSCGVLW